MKKALLLMVIISASLAMNGQDYKKFRMGFKVTPNISWMQPKDNNMESGGATVGFGFGLVADVFFAENYAFGSGLNITYNGGRVNYLEKQVVDDVEYIAFKERKIRNQFLEVPLTIKLRTNEIGYITYWGQFGLGLGFNLQTFADDVYDYQLEHVITDMSDSWEKTELASRAKDKENINDEIGFSRVSLIMAAGIEYNISGSTSVLVGLEFNNGFTNVFGSKERGVEQNDDGEALFVENAPEDFKLRSISNMFQLNLGILF